MMFDHIQWCMGLFLNIVESAATVDNVEDLLDQEWRDTDQSVFIIVF